MKKSKPYPLPSPPLPGVGPNGFCEETFDLIRTATRVETLVGEYLTSEDPVKGKPKPFFDLGKQEAQIIQVSLPMRMKLIWKSPSRARRISTEIDLQIVEADGPRFITLNDSRPGSSNLDDLHNYASYEIDGAILRKIKLNPFGGAGLLNGDIEKQKLRVGDIASWFSLPGSLRAQDNIWDAPKFSTGAKFAGQFPESPWGIWFATDAALPAKPGPSTRVWAPIFTMDTMEEYLKVCKNTRYDFSDNADDVVEIFNPEFEPVRVYTDSYTAGRNYLFADCLMKRIDAKGKEKGKFALADLDREAKALTKSILDTHAGLTYTNL